MQIDEILSILELLAPHRLPLLRLSLPQPTSLRLVVLVVLCFFFVAVQAPRVLPPLSGSPGGPVLHLYLLGEAHLQVRRDLLRIFAVLGVLVNGTLAALGVLVAVAVLQGFLLDGVCFHGVVEVAVVLQAGHGVFGFLALALAAAAAGFVAVAAVLGASGVDAT